LGDGEYTITVECSGAVASNVLILQSGDVLPTSTTTPGALPGTGSNRTGDLVRMGLAGIVLGAVVLVLVDRRRKHAVAAT
jgi:hypothetical protein